MQSVITLEAEKQAIDVGDTLLIVLLALPLAGSIASALLPVNARDAEAWLAGALAAVLVSANFYPAVARGETIRCTLGWLPQLRHPLPLPGREVD